MPKEMTQKQALIDIDLLDAINDVIKQKPDASWKKVLSLVLNPRKKPSQAAIADALNKASAQGIISVVMALCAISADNKPTKENIAIALGEALQNKQSIVVRYLSNLTTGNRLEQDLISELVDTYTPEKNDASPTSTESLLGADDYSTSSNLMSSQIEEPIPPGATSSKSTSTRSTDILDIYQNRQIFISSEEYRILNALYQFQEALKKITPHSIETETTLHTLQLSLADLYLDYITALYNFDKTEASIKKEYYPQFIKILTTARPDLANDLSYGEVFNNLLLSLLNVFIWIRDFGHTANFFKPIESQITPLLDELASSYDANGTGRIH